jgi:hypothetical protein
LDAAVDVSAPGARPKRTAGDVALGPPAGAGGAQIGVPVVQEKRMPDGSSVSARCTWRGAVALPLNGVAKTAAAHALARASARAAIVTAIRSRGAPTQGEIRARGESDASGEPAPLAGKRCFGGGR